MGFSYAYLSPGKYHQKENTMSKHPYPDHVRDAVADAIESLFMEADTWEKIDAAHDNLADTALQALWDASRVDDLHGLPDRAIYVDEHGGVGIVGRARQTGHCDMNQPATILYWGDASE